MTLLLSSNMSFFNTFHFEFDLVNFSPPPYLSFTFFIFLRDPNENKAF